MLAGLEQELQALAAIPLHPAARSQEHSTVLDLVDAPRVKEWAAQCQACHTNLAQKVTPATATVQTSPSRLHRQNLCIIGEQ